MWCFNLGWLYTRTRVTSPVQLEQLILKCRAKWEFCEYHCPSFPTMVIFNKSAWWSQTKIRYSLVQRNFPRQGLVWGQMLWEGSPIPSLGLVAPPSLSSVTDVGRTGSCVRLTHPAEDSARSTSPRLCLHAIISHSTATSYLCQAWSRSVTRGK